VELVVFVAYLRAGIENKVHLFPGLELGCSRWNFSSLGGGISIKNQSAHNSGQVTANRYTATGKYQPIRAQQRAKQCMLSLADIPPGTSSPPRAPSSPSRCRIRPCRTQTACCSPATGNTCGERAMPNGWKLATQRVRY
jgi:hypothetical protein